MTASTPWWSGAIVYRTCGMVSIPRDPKLWPNNYGDHLTSLTPPINISVQLRLRGILVLWEGGSDYQIFPAPPENKGIDW